MEINVLQMIDEIREKELQPYKDVDVIAKLAIIQVGDNPASNLYIKSKKAEMAKWKIEVEHYKFDGTNVTDIYIQIMKLNRDENVNGIILQLPLPHHLEIQKQRLINFIDPYKNVDGFDQYREPDHTKLKDIFFPCTPNGILEIIKRTTDIREKVVCVIGRGETVGKPLIDMLRNRRCTLICCNSSTDSVQLSEVLEISDIVITAVGKPGLVKDYNLKRNCIVIDAGISYVDGKQTGDFKHTNVRTDIKYTPRLNGVGKMTVAMLAQNTIIAAELQKGMM